jgi:hypothetical protein
MIVKIKNREYKQEDLIHFLDEIDLNAPKKNKNYYPYFKVVCTLTDIIGNEVEGIKYLDFTHSDGNTVGTNIAVERIKNLKSKGFKFVGYGNLPKTQSFIQAVQEITQDYDIQTAIREHKSKKDLNESAARQVQAEKDKLERDALIAEIRKQVESELKKGK